MRLSTNRRPAHNLLTLTAVTALVAAAGCTPQTEKSVPEVRRAELPEHSAARPPVDELQTTASRPGKAHQRNEASPGMDRVAPLVATRQAPADAGYWAPASALNRENYADHGRNPLQLASETPVSTFSIDVDTGAYSNVRRLLNAGQLPPGNAVRVEELINYFSYEYTPPESGRTPFSINTALTTTPWNPDTHLLQIGLQGYAADSAERPATNLVFLIDVSGSMQNPDKLPLLKNAFRLLTAQLGADDSIAMVVYAGSSGVVLEPTPGNERATIIAALDQLRAGGSTHGDAGITQAYRLAQQAYIEGGINRVILATDGDFNVGLANIDALVDKVAERRRSGISMTTLGFGAGNYNDALMEQLADAGNGHYAYIDNLLEARKVLVEELGATLQTIAKDVKIQVEFNPAWVAEYRLIGYENRVLEREDFNNDQVDAGEIGAGHTVTALYEVALVGSAGRRLDPLRYAPVASDAATENAPRSDEIAFVRLRHKTPAGNRSQLTERVVSINDDVPLARANDELRFAAAVAAFGQRLRGGEYLQGFDYADIRRLAAEARGADRHGYRGEFLALVDLAASLAAAIPERSAAN